MTFVNYFELKVKSVLKVIIGIINYSGVNKTSSLRQIDDYYLSLCILYTREIDSVNVKIILRHILSCALISLETSQILTTYAISRLIKKDLLANGYVHD